MSTTDDRLLRPAVVAGAVLLLAVAIARQGQVIAEGALLPFFESYEVTQVRVLGLDLYVDRSADAGDALTAGTLAAVAALLLLAARHLAGRPRRAFVRAGFGAIFLSADDLLSAHETLGHNLAALATIPLVDHPDDAVLAVYAAVVVAFCWHERALVRGTAARPWWIAGAAAGLAVAHDVSPLHLRALEEGLEVLAAVAALVGVATVARHHIRAAARADSPAAAE